MSGPDDRDEALLAELGRVLHERAEPPPEVIASAKELFAWRTVDTELAALTYDSLLDEEPASVRSTSQALRTLTFDADGLTIELEIDTGVTGRRLLGQLVPAEVDGLTVTSDDIAVSPELDAFGRFGVPIPAVTSRITLRVVRSGGRAVVSLVVDV